jgi:Na+/H+ antiporter NhaD/arsenite permease-like protein
VVFFIFMVSNAGGSLTPLGDPPLFLGFLKGVDFFWTVQPHLPRNAVPGGQLLAIFYLLDRWYYRQEGVLAGRSDARHPRIGFDGAINFWLLAAVVGLVLLSGFWKTPLGFDVFGTAGRPAGAGARCGPARGDPSLAALTPAGCMQTTSFRWGPMQEVAKLFAGIFLTIIPVIAMLKAGTQGPFGAIVSAVTRPTASPTRPCISGPPAR